LTSGIVVVAGVLGLTVFRFPLPGAAGEDAIGRFAAGDGSWYASIARHGYERGDAAFQDVAFLPAFPLVARWLAWGASLRTEVALLLVANCFLLAAFVVGAAFVRCRYPDESPEVTDYALLALGLVPTTFFFRMAYSEAMFLFLTVSVLLGMMRRWPTVILALLVGLATATRPVGIALVPPFALYLFRLSPTPTNSTDRFRRPASRLLRALPFLALSCWGLIAFMLFQWIAFGDPLGFAKWQWRTRLTLAPEASVLRELFGELTLEPIWGTYVPSKWEYWERYGAPANPLFNLRFANPIYFVGTIVLVAVGWRKKWLNEYEILLAAGLLLIPYLTKSYGNAMGSFGRFSAVVFPIYPVIGHLMHRLGGPLSTLVFVGSAFLLAVYSALFAAYYRLG